MAAAHQESTFIAIKPDGVRRGLVHEVIGRFERRGYTLAAMKMVTADRKILEEHYAEHKGKAFLSDLLAFMTSGPIILMVWKGQDVIAGARKIMGATNPANAEMGSLRADFCTEVTMNLVHGSDSKESAAREIKLWFNDETLV